MDATVRLLIERECQRLATGSAVIVDGGYAGILAGTHAARRGLLEYRRYGGALASSTRRASTV